MRAADAAAWLAASGGEDVAVTVRFPQLGGWEVTSWAVAPGEAEGSRRWRWRSGARTSTTRPWRASFAGSAAVEAVGRPRRKYGGAVGGIEGRVRLVLR